MTTHPRSTPAVLALAAILLPAGAWPSAAASAQAPAAGTVPAPPLVQELEWMTGCWEGVLSSGATYEEMWTAPRGGLMLGTARMIREGRVVSWEFLQIGDGGEGPLYVARPSGQAPTGFRAVNIDGASATFENPEHDFPQKILYRFTPPNRLDARIEGERDGRLQGMDFPLRRVGCERPEESATGDRPHRETPSEVEGYRAQVAIFMTAAPAALEDLRARMPEDDFHAVADDLMWYRAEASGALADLTVPVVQLNGRRTLHFLVGGQVRAYDFREVPTLDLVVLYRPPEPPEAVAPIELLDVLAQPEWRKWRARPDPPSS